MKEIVKILNCPLCRKPTELEIVEKKKMDGDRLIDGTIVCKGIPRHRFIVRHGIIIFSNDVLPVPSDEDIEKAIRPNSRNRRTN